MKVVMEIWKWGKHTLECADCFNLEMKCEDVFLFCQELVLKCSGSFTDPEHIPIMYSHRHTEFVERGAVLFAELCDKQPQCLQQQITLKYRSETQQRTNHSQSRERDIKTIIQPPSWQSRMSQRSCGTISTEQELLCVVKCILPH